MIELSFRAFHEQNYRKNNYSLYVMKNGFGDVLYVGISTVNVWERWFGRGEHMTWDGNVIYGDSTIGEKIENHLPDSLNWKIQLWTLKDCLEYCKEELISDKSNITIRDIEAKMIRKLSPALNIHLNQNPSKDTTPKSKKEENWEKYVDQAYDEIFNSKE